MEELQYDVAIIGGGPAGLAAAYGAHEEGAKRIVIIERDRELGGILQQCIHNGFGLHRFQEELTGPGYASRFIRMTAGLPGLDIFLDTMAVQLTSDRTLWVISPDAGLRKITAKAIVLAMGCRERTRGAIRIPGSRPSGIFTAGAAQRLVNMEGYLPGKKIVILGSGDIGLIMARRMTLEGAKVEAVLELMPYSNGLTRNIVQCLEDYGIPLYLSHTITAIHGKDRVTGVTCAPVDDTLRPKPEAAFDIECDCLLLSVGLIPENELTREAGIPMDSVSGGPIVDQNRQTAVPGIFAAGNVVHVHDLVDWVSAEGETAGRSAARFAGTLMESCPQQDVISGENVRTVVPQRLCQEPDARQPVRLYVRASKPMRSATLQILGGGAELFTRKFPVVKPSEMLVMDVPTAAIADRTGPLTVRIQ